MSELVAKLDHLAKYATGAPAWVRREIAECAKLARDNVAVSPPPTGERRDD